MTKTLEALWEAASDSDEAMRAYDSARAAKVAKIAAFIRDHLNVPATAYGYANRAMDKAEEMGRIAGDDISGELPGSATTSGNPLSFTI